ncbi:MAG TPA: bifunctional diguanylate cyclase/phosphodiesterase [Actinoplanes sp.]|nr:bifunctional diguanylate cyclase/phosphodiesterase [Actinoplanes sp.]
MAGLGAAVVYTLPLPPVVGLAACAVVGAGVVWACFTGPPRHRAHPAGAWTLAGFAVLALLTGLLVRPWASTQPFPLSLLADAAIVPGYVLTTVFLVRLLRARQSVEWHAVLDGLIVCLSAGLACVLLLAMPAAAIADRPAAVSAVAGMYPLLDVTLVLLVANLTLTARGWPLSLLTFLGSMTMLFAGDLAYAIIGRSGLVYASPMLDLPYLVALTFLGVTVLHPSVAELSRATRPPPQAWSRRRLGLLAPAMITPFVLLVTVGGESAMIRLVIAGTGAVLVLLLLVRAVSAVRAQVATQLRSEHQARHDPLTGLPNRRMIADEIERLLSRLPPSGPRRVWVFLLDLDGFKLVNESWGHDTGDQVVIEAAARLRSAVPAQHMVARVGGDEFLIAYLGEKAGALRLVDDIRGCFTRPLRVRGTDVVISASIGLAHAGGDLDGSGQHDPSLTAEALMRDADTAMYRSKAEGPGRSTIFDTAMHDRVRERIELEAALRTALAEGQLRVAYQPIVQLDTGRPVGTEALVRWDHPERGPVPPMAFIPVAEDAGMIGQIGDVVRREALRQLGEWRANGTVADDFYVSVNVSPRQLSDPELPLIISAELLEHRVPARTVALEMTESVMVDGSSITSRVLFELRELGVRLLVDDFGTGFSALGYLRRFPVTGVKVDRSFVAGLGQSRPDEEIVRAVVAMSSAMGLSVVAEGVENRRQRDVLAAAGVTQGQGWLWGPAVPPADFAARWHAGGPAARAAVAAAIGHSRNERSTPPRAKNRNQLPAVNP